MLVIRSRENARVKAWARLAEEPAERRKLGLALLEGVHLVEAFLARGGTPASLIVSESALGNGEITQLVQRAGLEPVLLADALFKRISDAQAPSGIAVEMKIPDQPVDPVMGSECVFLEGIQDAGNVGAILRSAAAFGIPHVILGRGCADPWSPKVLRAGMGGHFFLRIAVSEDLEGDVRRFGLGTVCTAARGGQPIELLNLTGRTGWIFGSEGAGVSAALAAAASHTATIATPGGTESLNVAASAAICFYERQRQLSRRGAGA